MTEHITRHRRTVIDEWTHEGLRCKVVFDKRLGHWCGYVRTPLRGYLRPLDTKLYRLIDVSGGITYRLDDDGWIGFDTAHARDHNVSPDGEPAMGAEMNDPTEETVRVWDEDAIKEETEELAKQLRTLVEVVENVE